MLALDTRSTWVLVALLLPLWWATALVGVACLANVFPSWRRFASRLFDRIEHLPDPAAMAP